MSQPNDRDGRPARQGARGLVEASSHPGHQFWPPTISRLHDGLILTLTLMQRIRGLGGSLWSLGGHWPLPRGGRFVDFDPPITTAELPTATAVLSTATLRFVAMLEG